MAADANGLDLSGATQAASDAESVGSNAINNYDPTGASANATSLATSNFNTAQNQNQSMTDQYAKAVAANPTVTDLYNKGNSLYNVPQLQTQATNLTNQVSNAQPDAYSAAKGFDISNAQLQNGVQNRLSYLQPMANTATANANTASGLASQYVQAGQLQNTQNLAPAVAQASLTSQNMAAEATGWNTALSSQLSGLLEKMQAGITLSSSEYTMASQLAAQETAYQDQVLQNEQAANTATKTLAGTMYTANHQNIAQGGTSYNSATGSYYTPQVGSGVVPGAAATS